MTMNTFSRMRKSVLLFAAGVLLCSTASAAGSAVGKVISVTATKNNMFAVRIGPVTNLAPCATPGSQEFALDISTAGRRAMMATILAAQAQGLTLTAFGTGACEVASDRETLLYFIAG